MKLQEILALDFDKNNVFRNILSFGVKTPHWNYPLQMSHFRIIRNLCQAICLLNYLLKYIYVITFVLPLNFNIFLLNGLPLYRRSQLPVITTNVKHQLTHAAKKTILTALHSSSFFVCILYF